MADRIAAAPPPLSQRWSGRIHLSRTTHDRTVRSLISLVDLTAAPPEPPTIFLHFSVCARNSQCWTLPLPHSFLFQHRPSSEIPKLIGFPQSSTPKHLYCSFVVPKLDSRESKTKPPRIFHISLIPPTHPLKGAAEAAGSENIKQSNAQGVNASDRCLS